MPTDWLEALPKLVAIVEKGGIIGLLIIVVGVLCWVCLKYRKELIGVYSRLDECRLVRERYRAALTEKGIKVDISDILDDMRRERSE